jgi:hypothetical protein
MRHCRVSRYYYTYDFINSRFRPFFNFNDYYLETYVHNHDHVVYIHNYDHYNIFLAYTYHAIANTHTNW